MAERKAATIGRNPLAWAEISEPGAYVDVTTGALYRVSHEVLRKRAFPAGDEGGATASQVVRVSADPSIFPLGARIICARYNIHPNF